MLVSRAEDGSTTRGETYTLSGSAAAFSDLTRNPPADTASEAALVAYLRRVIEAEAPILTAEDLAWVLAAYAKIARTRSSTGTSPRSTTYVSR